MLRLGVTGWTRMHGVVSLEVEGHFTQMGFDPGLLFEAEVESLIAEATGSEAG
ncbi:TetR-like C-terminal domain-containing protein [Phytohabitans flavus]|uniref:TetR-like C-terminal domain-containing protein n=1 Tax=Phytohabitans flavus TaxID=1076124 RepID=UPI003639E812